MLNLSARGGGGILEWGRSSCSSFTWTWDFEIPKCQTDERLIILIYVFDVLAHKLTRISNELLNLTSFSKGRTC